MRVNGAIVLRLRPSWLVLHGLPVVGVGRFLTSINAVSDKVIRLEGADRSSSVKDALKTSLCAGTLHGGRIGNVRALGGFWVRCGQFFCL